MLAIVVFSASWSGSTSDSSLRPCAPSPALLARWTTGSTGAIGLGSGHGSSMTTNGRRLPAFSGSGGASFDDWFRGHGSDTYFLMASGRYRLTRQRVTAGPSSQVVTAHALMAQASWSGSSPP